MQGQNLGSWGLSRNGNGAIVIEGFPCDQIIRNFGTPLHVMSKSKLLSTLDRFVLAFKRTYENTNVMYAYKAGSIPAVLEIIHERDIGAEVISGYELWLALKTGVSPSAIVFNGPLKRVDDLQLAIQKEIFSINVDSVDDMRRIENVAREVGKPANIGIRLSLDGAYSNFGIPQSNEILFPVLDAIMNSPWLSYRGLMTHLGGRSTDAGVYVRGVEAMAEVAEVVRQRCGSETLFFDVGGGVGVETLRGFSLLENALYRKFNIPPKPPKRSKFESIEKVAEKTVVAMKTACSRHRVSLPRLVIEPGRALVASSQLLLLTIHAVKRNRKQSVAITDGGRFNVNYPVDHEYHEIFLANRRGEGASVSYFISGRICTIGDFVHRNLSLPELKVGDIIAIMDSGAYFTQFSTNFSFPRPGILMIDGNQCTLIRQAETYDHLIAMDSYKGR